MKYVNAVLAQCFLVSIMACATSPNTLSPDAAVDIPPVSLNFEQAQRLATLPLDCINTEYPNKLNDVIGSDADLKPPRVLHPAFYGCFDWHSAVHGHWSLVKLLKLYPDLENADEIKQKLLNNISADNMQKEIEFFYGKYNKSWERTYGWAWYLKLVEELHTWDDPVARELETNLTPLADLLVQRYFEFLPKLLYPIRVGEHTNSAFGMNFAWDYAVAVKDQSFQALLKQHALRFFAVDTNCPINYEPSGFDFLSPCLEEAALMKRVLSATEFRAWMDKFLPQLADPDFEFDVGKVSDRGDGKLVHLDGVNFSRAWSLSVIADGLPAYAHLNTLANAHVQYSLPGIVGDSYEGGHWLGSFAIYALSSQL
ncbi:MAG: DUF2891 domain-containing protein [Gammaproteobacteria bacterium]|nr:DUF2891 domain-containing protein [Gammaproteobacteria bacterium]NNC96913.1 DUF2891 domain-containing protein [Gammaproteobacteria bacterium]NNM13328.1 DUF2891 domain-containing protein [Gammaproteobacteria bacterium]